MARSKAEKMEIKGGKPVEDVRGLITAEVFVEKLRAFLAKGLDKDTVSVAEIKELLAKVILPNGLSPNNVAHAIKEIVNAHADNNPSSGGLSGANIWREVSRRYGGVVLPVIERALDDLVDAGELELEDSEVTRGYLPVRDESEK